MAGAGRYRLSDHGTPPAWDVALTSAIQQTARTMARRTDELVETWRAAQSRPPLRVPPTVREDRSQAARWQRRRFCDEQALNRHQGITLRLGPLQFEGPDPEDGDTYRVRVTRRVGIGVGRHV